MELTAVTFFDLVRDDLNLVEAQLRTTIPAEPEAVSVAVARLINAGGKRLRPVLALLAGRLFECDLDRSVCVAAAVETLHTATLVHDDLVDGSLLRRGIRTLNSQWSPRSPCSPATTCLRARLRLRRGPIPLRSCASFPTRFR